MDKLFVATGSLREGLDQVSGTLSDLTDAVLTLAIVQAMGGGRQSAAGAHRDVMEIFEAVSMGGEDEHG